MSLETGAERNSKTFLPAISPFAVDRTKSQRRGANLAPGRAESILDEKVISSIPSPKVRLRSDQNVTRPGKLGSQDGIKKSRSQGLEMPKLETPKLVMPTVETRNQGVQQPLQEPIVAANNSLHFPDPPRRLRIEMPRGVLGTLAAPTAGSAKPSIHQPNPVMPAKEEPLSPSDLIATRSSSRSPAKKPAARPKRSVIVPPVPTVMAASEAPATSSSAAPRRSDRTVASTDRMKVASTATPPENRQRTVLAASKLKPHRLGSATPPSAGKAKHSEEPNPGLVQANPFASRPVVELARRTEGVRRGVIHQPPRKRHEAVQGNSSSTVKEQRAVTEKRTEKGDTHESKMR